MSYFGSIQGIETLIPLETLRKERPELVLPEFVRCDAGEFMMGGVKFDSECLYTMYEYLLRFGLGSMPLHRNSFYQ